jgi:hypothetical protein
MTPLEVEFEVMDSSLLVRVCGPPPEGEEGRRLILVSERHLRGLSGVLRSWWLCVGLVDEESVSTAAAGLMQRPPSTSLAIHQGLLIHGAAWEKVCTWDEALRQALAWSEAPAGIDRLSEVLILRTRALVFGDDFTRTARALEAVADSYCDDTLEPDARARVLASRALRAETGEGPSS